MGESPVQLERARGTTQGRGPLIVLSGPSGSGKSTVLERLLAAADLPVHLSVSATTRLPRPGEIDGKHYHFWSRERFAKELEANAFLEHAEVHGNCYGTLRCEVDPYRDRGLAVLLDIDVQGADQVRQKCPDLVTVFLQTSSLDAYEARLRKRATEDEATIRRRLAAAQRELARAPEYQYRVINDDLDVAVAQLRSIVRHSLEGGKHAG
jgi:guanylate kinase